MLSMYFAISFKCNLLQSILGIVLCECGVGWPNYAFECCELYFRTNVCLLVFIGALYRVHVCDS